MKHAGPAALDDLEDVLVALRRHAAFRERKRGAFYVGGSAFLHFHEDPAGPFADLKVAGAWKRLRVATKAERAKLLRATAQALNCGGPSPFVHRRSSRSAPPSSST